MPKLKNPKHELLAKNLLKEKFNQVKAYKATYGVSQKTAEGNASNVIEKYGVMTRAMEIAERYSHTKLVNLINSFSDDLTAERPYVTKSGVEYSRDNAVILEAKKFLISKVHGVGNDSKAGDTYNIDARSVTVTTDDAKVLTALCDRIDTLNDNLKQGRKDRAEAIDI